MTESELLVKYKSANLDTGCDYLINWLGTSSPSLPRLLWMMLEEGPSGLCFMNRKKSAVTELSSDNMRSGAPKLSPRHTS